MSGKKISRSGFLKNVIKSAVVITGLSTFIKGLMAPAGAATGPCMKCDFSMKMYGKIGYLSCFQIAGAKQLSLKDTGDYRKATFRDTESSCPAGRDHNLPGFKVRTDNPFPPNMGSPTPYGATGHRVTPGIFHPRDRVYSCSRCGYQEFFILTDGHKAKLLLCAKCSNLMQV